MAKVIMIQGTMSNVGKSIIAGGLCRIFKQDGYRTAPFKAQNMALNSYITKDGLEMGRAQVMQAEAAGIDADVRMNPILLKPTNDTGSQVIVMGEVFGDMSAREYYRRKREFIPYIKNAFDGLMNEYDIVVIEGAGSPAEINLKKDDIVNMGMAKMAKAPVLLVGDIDRGGVFAQLIGTVDLLEEKERQYIKGMIINKFRGDKRILQSGLDMLEEKSKKKIIGVIPYIKCDIDEEDSLSDKFRRKNYDGIINIDVVRLPRISNFTDFNAFEYTDGVRLRYAERKEEIGDGDITIIPGTKNTADDMIWLRESGIEGKIKKAAAGGKIIIGICGGYQMLGESIKEGEREIRAMGLLPIKTVFEERKTRTRIEGEIKNIGGILRDLKAERFEGYEIHSGISEITEEYENMNDIWNIGEKGGRKGDGLNIGNIYGTYVHGIFDNEEIVKKIVYAVMREKGIDGNEIKTFDMKKYKERQYDILAEEIRKNADMEKIYEIIEEGIK